MSHEDWASDPLIIYDCLTWQREDSCMYGDDYGGGGSSISGSGTGNYNGHGVSTTVLVGVEKGRRRETTTMMMRKRKKINHPLLDWHKGAANMCEQFYLWERVLVAQMIPICVPLTLPIHLDSVSFAFGHVSFKPFLLHVLNYNVLLHVSKRVKALIADEAPIAGFWWQNHCHYIFASLSQKSTCLKEERSPF